MLFNSLILEKYFYNKCYNINKSKNIFIAYSGGIDSSILLHLLHKTYNNNFFFLKAIHINHMYNENSNKWSAFCKKQCDIIKIPLNIIQLKNKIKSNIEESFRIERYNFFSKNIKNDSVLFLGHNKNDFLETFLLRLFRGSGIYGLNSINESINLGKIKILRPLLNVSRKDIIKYSYNNNIKYINDFSNFDNKFDRNYLRNKIIPIVFQKWNSIINSITRYVKIIYLNNKYINNIISTKYFDAIKNNNAISIIYILSLSKYIRFEVLRFWIKEKNLKSPSYIHLEEINKILKSENSNSFINLKQYIIKRFRDKIYIIKSINNKYIFKIYKKNKTIYKISNDMVISYFALGKGIKYNCKKYRLIIGKTNKKIKKIFQMHNVPIWERYKYPIIMEYSNLVMIIGLWVSNKYYVNNKKEKGLVIKLL